MDVVGLRCRRHENRQGRQSQDVLPHAPAGEPGNPVKSPGTEHDRLAMPLPRLLDDAARHVLLQH